MVKDDHWRSPCSPTSPLRGIDASSTPHDAEALTTLPNGPQPGTVSGVSAGVSESRRFPPLRRTASGTEITAVPPSPDSLQQRDGVLTEISLSIRPSKCHPEVRAKPHEDQTCLVSLVSRNFVANILHRCRRTEPRSQVTCI